MSPHLTEAPVFWLDGRVVESCPVSNTVSQSGRHVLTRFYFPPYKWEQQIVSRFSTFSWVRVRCSGCLRAGKGPRDAGGSVLFSEDLCPWVGSPFSSPP